MCAAPNDRAGSQSKGDGERYSTEASGIHQGCYGAHLSTEGRSLRSKDRNLQILIATMERERLFARFFWVCLGMVALMQLIGLLG